MRARLALIAVALAPLLPVGGAAHEFDGASVRCDRDCLVARTAAADRPTRSLPAPLALVTAETENRLLVVSLPSGQIEREVPVPSDPEDIATTADNGGLAIVVSSSAGDVSVINPATLRVLKTFGGFDEPHIVEASPDGQHAYVTDDSRGTVTAIRLSDMSITSTINVGVGAHHIAFSPDQRDAWVALGEAASQITILNTSNIDHPHVTGHFTPGFPAHDLAFTPDGRQIWITSSDSDYVTAFDVQDHRVLFRVRAGAPPQHLVFDGAYAYITSGYGSQIEKASEATGQVLARASAPYGSFELAAADGYLATSSLLRGTLAIYTPDLKPLKVVAVAPAAREVAITRP